MTSYGQTCHQTLEKILHVVMFLAERGLAFRGASDRVGEHNNGNFLGILELLALYDPVICDHMKNVRKSQECGEKRLQVHYISPQSQNEFISACASQVLSVILQQVYKMKYYSLVVDATPDRSHKEQTTFILRYVLETVVDGKSAYQVVERFMTFVCFAKKTGLDIATIVLDQLKVHALFFTWQYSIVCYSCRSGKCP